MFAFLLLLLLLASLIQSLHFSIDNIEFTNWLNIGEFSISFQGEVKGSIRNNVPLHLSVFEENFHYDLLLHSPTILVCDLISKKSIYQQRLEPLNNNIQFYLVKPGRYHIFLFSNCDNSFVPVLELVQPKTTFNLLHRLYHSRHSVKSEKNPIIASYDLHIVNIGYFLFNEFSEEEFLLFPITIFFTIYFFILTRFQIVTFRVLSTNTGITLSTFILLIVLIKFFSLFLHSLSLILFFFNGIDNGKGLHDSKYVSAFMDGISGLITTIFLMLTSKGWMIIKPEVYFDWYLIIVLSIYICSLGYSALMTILFSNETNRIYPSIFAGSTQIYLFITIYSDLVILMRKSRNYIGAKIRGRAFSTIAYFAILGQYQVILLTFVTLTIQAFSASILVWSFRPERVWELHGERPDVEVVKLLVATNSADSIDGEMEKLIV